MEPVELNIFSGIIRYCYRQTLRRSNRNDLRALPNYLHVDIFAVGFEPGPGSRFCLVNLMYRVHRIAGYPDPLYKTGALPLKERRIESGQIFYSFLERPGKPVLSGKIR